MPTTGQPPSPGNNGSARRKVRLALECTVLFLGLPAVIAAGWIHALVIPVLVLMAAGCALALRRSHQVRLRDLIRPRVPPAEWRRVLLLFAAAVPGLVALLWLINPAALCSLPQHHPKIWLLVMVVYPLVSVVPQELVYRAFFFERYRPLFGSGRGLILAAALVFSFGHVVFHNWPAVLLTAAGGWLFATTYRRSSSLFLVSVEHALYGCAIFTIGYGTYFFDGTLRLFR
jgi:membrane protease YdiL (CAAX protease family)